MQRGFQQILWVLGGIGLVFLNRPTDVKKGESEITMPTYKLFYFPVRGLAEPICYILSYGGVEFEDVRFSKEDWQQIKPTMPFAKVPVLEIDGKKIHQSKSISRYLAKQFGIAGKNDWEALEIDATVATIDDLRVKIGVWYSEQHPEAKEAKYEPVFKEMIPFVVSRLDAQVKDNEGYFVGGALSWADLFFVAILERIEFMTELDVIKDHENLKQLRSKVLALPSIKAWVAKRPVTETSVCYRN